MTNQTRTYNTPAEQGIRAAREQLHREHLLRRDAYLKSKREMTKTAQNHTAIVAHEFRNMGYQVKTLGKFVIVGLMTRNVSKSVIELEMFNHDIPALPCFRAEQLFSVEALRYRYDGKVAIDCTNS